MCKRILFRCLLVFFNEAFVYHDALNEVASKEARVSYIGFHIEVSIETQSFSLAYALVGEAPCTPTLNLALDVYRGQLWDLYIS